MQAIIEPGNISGTFAAPPSKSMTQRAYAGALLHSGTTVVHNAGNSEDEQAALGVIQQLGAQVEEYIHEDKKLKQITIHSTGVVPVSDHINCGESGLAARLFTPIAALSDSAMRIEGSGTLRNRPMEGFNETLPQLAVQIKDFTGHLPFTLQGPLQATSIAIDASSGSQLLSGILFAVSSSIAESPVIITATGLKSKPYIDLTIDVLARFGKIITHKDYKEFSIDPSLFTKKETVEINVEADWSSASAFLVAGAIAGDVTIKNLDIRSAQADKMIVDVLREAGASVSIYDDTVSVRKAPLRAFDFDATHCPDLFPVLAILAACCDGESYIRGVHRLFNKESNRAESIADMLQNFDVPFSLEDDSFCITGVRKLQGTVIDTYHDHRIVMAAAVGALRARGRVDINGAEAVHKSYPRFFEDLVLCGGRCKFNP